MYFNITLFYIYTHGAVFTGLIDLPGLMKSGRERENKSSMFPCCLLGTVPTPNHSPSPKGDKELRLGASYLSSKNRFETWSRDGSPGR